MCLYIYLYLYLYLYTNAITKINIHPNLTLRYEVHANEDVNTWLEAQSCAKPCPQKRRKVNKKQRLEANGRERRRMDALNTAFELLRGKIPAFPYEKRLSRIQVFR